MRRRITFRRLDAVASRLPDPTAAWEAEIRAEMPDDVRAAWDELTADQFTWLIDRTPLPDGTSYVPLLELSLWFVTTGRAKLRDD